MAIHIVDIDHVVIRVRDPERIISFWKEALGCVVEKVQPDLGLVHIRAGTALVDLVDVNGKLGREGGPAPGQQARNMDHFCLRIDPFNAEEIASHMVSRGIKVEAPKRRFGASGYGPSIYIFDPEGNRIELKGPSEVALP